MLSIVKWLNCTPKRTFKNFGHKRDPEPVITIFWQGFLTFTFMGLLLNWKWVGNFLAKNSKEYSEESVDLENTPSN